MAKIETLECKNGKHEWQRTSARGRKPVNCPSHPDVVVPKRPVKMMEDLDTGTMVPAVTGAALAERVYERMQILIRKDAERRAVR